MNRKRISRLTLYGALGVAVLLFLLHPCTRQAGFGPRIRGEPLWTWQQRYRRAAAPSEYREPLVQKAAGLLGIKPFRPGRILPEDEDLLPLALSLVNDELPRV